MENKNAFKEIEELLEKLREANRKLKEHTDNTQEEKQQGAVVLPFKKHKEQ